MWNLVDAAGISETSDGAIVSPYVELIAVAMLPKS